MSPAPGPDYPPLPRYPHPKDNGNPICNATDQQSPPKPGNREGYWSNGGQCHDLLCIPGSDLQIVWSINLGRYLTLLTWPVAYGAAPDPSAPCQPSYTVWRTYLNTEYTGANLFMIDPVAPCSGPMCNLDPAQHMYGWAQVAVDRRLGPYFAEQIPLAELQQLAPDDAMPGHATIARGGPHDP